MRKITKVQILRKTYQVYTHICLLCLKEINEKVNHTNEIWNSALCKLTNLSNEYIHEVEVK